MRRAREHRYWRRTRALLGALLALWAAATFGLVSFARELNAWSFAGWPLGYWLAAQGIPLGFLVIVIVHAWVMARADEAFESER